jgi:hypothetical protein
VDEDIADCGRVGDEGDDAYVGAAERTHERENFVDAREQPRQAYRAARRWAGSAAGSGLGAGGEVVAASARPVTAVPRGELGASTPK